MIFFVGERIACTTFITVWECFYNLIWNKAVKGRMHSNKCSYYGVAQINRTFVLINGIDWYLYPLGRWHNCNPNTKVTYQICRKCSYNKSGVNGLNCVPRVSSHIRMTPVMCYVNSILFFNHVSWVTCKTSLFYNLIMLLRPREIFFIVSFYVLHCKSMTKSKIEQSKYQQPVYQVN